MHLSIIIVNYRSAGDIINCLESAMKYSQPASFEWIIVDSFSNDKSREIITDRFPFVQWIQLDYNAGYSRANNEGIKRSKGEIVLVLNPDVIFEDNAIEKCLRQMEASEYVASTIQLLNADKSPQISGSYFMKGGLNHLLPLPFIGTILKWIGEAFKVKKTSVFEVKGTKEVDWINGAFMMVKKEAIEKAGMFDEDFFLYAEEIEWCSRLRRVGKLAVFGNFHAIHLEGQSTNQTFDSSGKGYYNLFDKKGRQIMISNFVRIRKQFGVAWFLFHLVCYLIEIPFSFLIAFFSTIFFIKNGYKPSQFIGYVSNLFYLLGKSFRIIQNKPYFYKVI